MDNEHNCILSIAISAQRYRDGILRLIDVLFICRHHLMFQHDNARPHVARIFTQFQEAENVPVLPWPAYSPDMSPPIEHEEGSTTHFPPEETEKIWHGSPDSQKVPQRHHRELPDRLACYGNCSASDHKVLQRVVCTAQYITGAKLPAIQDIHTRWCQRKAQKIL